MRSRSSSLLLAVLFAAPLGAKENAATKAARESFETVEASANVPPAAEVRACIQAQREAQKATPKPERFVLEARRSYCSFLDAAIAQDSAALRNAAANLTSARGNDRNDSAPLLKVAAAIAVLKSNPSPANAPKALQDLSEPLNCLTAGFASTRTCNALSGAASLWIGLAALNRAEFPRAEEAFRRVDGSPWNVWLTGIYQQEAQHWREAQLSFASASDAWRIRGTALIEWLGPRPALGEVPARLAYAQVLAGDGQAAIPALEAALAVRPDDPRSLFLRARLLDSLPDLEIAVKAAAKAGNFPLYRAILLERRRDYAGAIHEFDALLASSHDPSERSEIQAWKSLAQASAGECAGDPDAIEQAAATATPLFPKQELTSALLDCRVRRSTSLGQLIALDSLLRPRYFTPGVNDPLRERMAAAFNRIGVQAEDRKDPVAAIASYRRALEWSPRNTKAHFNLGALYLGEEKFPEAETEYRALIDADPNDREAQFWLAESILAAKPDVSRRTEACAFLQQSIKIQDSAKRDQFATAFSTSPCAN